MSIVTTYSHNTSGPGAWRYTTPDPVEGLTLSPAAPFLDWVQFEYTPVPWTPPSPLPPGVVITPPPAPPIGPPAVGSVPTAGTIMLIGAALIAGALVGAAHRVRASQDKMRHHKANRNLRTQVRELEAAVCEAYCEGFGDAQGGHYENMAEGWEDSVAKKALAGEGE